MFVFSRKIAKKKTISNGFWLFLVAPRITSYTIYTYSCIIKLPAGADTHYVRPALAIALDDFAVSSARAQPACPCGSDSANNYYHFAQCIIFIGTGAYLLRGATHNCVYSYLCIRRAEGSCDAFGCYMLVCLHAHVTNPQLNST